MAQVLVVDDDLLIITFIKGVLKAAGHDVIATDNPDDALTLAEHAHFDLFVLDVMMPVASGYDVMQAFRMTGANRDSPVLFLTSLADARDRTRGLKEGADDYLVKPFDPDELVVRVERLLARSKKPNAKSG